MDLAKYVPLHAVLFAAGLTGMLALLGQFFLREPYRSQLHLDFGTGWSVAIIVIVVFCFVLWVPALRSTQSKLHVPHSFEDRDR